MSMLFLQILLIGAFINKTCAMAYTLPIFVISFVSQKENPSTPNSTLPRSYYA
jgi:hypothetical protein